MTKRTGPQKATDERYFPVRLCIRQPAEGFGKALWPLFQWLDDNAGRGNYAWHSHGAHYCANVCAIYLRSPALAAAFCAAWPDLILADGVDSTTYTSPNLIVAPGAGDDESVCNLYRQTTAQDAMRQLFKGAVFADRAGNLEPGQIYPDRLAPIIRHDRDSGGLELVRARWGMPSPPAVLKTERDPGVTNVRNIRSPHWRRWLGPADRCLVPLTAFAEPLGAGRGNQWFAAVDDRPMFFAGMQTRGWRSVRKVKDGPTEDDLFAFLTCAPNALVATVHPKAMPVILTEPKEWDLWMSAPLEIVAALQRPLADGVLRAIDVPA